MSGKTLVNLTPHDVYICGRLYPRSGVLARVTIVQEDVGTLGDIPLIVRTVTGVVNLPEPREGVMFIVSSFVRQASPDRLDLVTPGNVVFENGIRQAINLVVNGVE